MNDFFSENVGDFKNYFTDTLEIRTRTRAGRCEAGTRLSLRCRVDMGGVDHEARGGYGSKTIEEVTSLFNVEAMNFTFSARIAF